MFGKKKEIANVKPVIETPKVVEKVEPIKQELPTRGYAKVLAAELLGENLYRYVVETNVRIGDIGEELEI